MTLKERLKAAINNFAWEQDWNIQEYAVHKRDIDYRRGKADAYGDVVYRLHEIIDKPVGNSDKMTLTEFARELRKIFKFKYLTVESTFGRLYFAAWTRKPLWNGKRGYMFWHRRKDVYRFLAGDFFNTFLAEEIDLSEYADKDGNIDYSKCIVEVTE